MLKRVTDITGALIGLILLTPLFVLITLILLITTTSNPFFSQQRPGKNGKIFTLYKFRTMNNKKDKDGTLLPDMQRITKTGSFLRKTSLDELPQLWNVLKGDMSLVGPRPLLVDYLPLYSKEQSRRHDVLPGITGWAQINGRNKLTWKEKFELDLHYVDNQSFYLDIKIILSTIKNLFKAKDINKSGEETMEWFNGNN